MRRALLLVGTAWVFLGIAPASVAAQSPLSEELSRLATAETQTVPRIPEVEPAARQDSRGVLVPLYISAATLQMLDVHSTHRALSSGYTEGNPMMAGIASNTAAFVAVKAATAATTIWVSEKLRKRNRAAAIGLMVAVNVATATVVAHNYRVVH
jgi:uncharacterized protein DUF5658